MDRRFLALVAALSIIMFGVTWLLLSPKRLANTDATVATPTPQTRKEGVAANAAGDSAPTQSASGQSAETIDPASLADLQAPRR